MSASYYAVEFTTVVDRPDRRDATYPTVEAGHTIHTRWTYLTRKEAVSMFNAIVRGEWDFGSEYVRTATVLDCDAYGDRSPKWVRRPIERKRKAGVGACGYDCGHALCTEVARRDAADNL